MTKPDMQSAITSLAPANAGQAIEDFSELLQSLYAGPLESVPWHSFLNALKKHTAADGAVLILRHPSASDLGAIVTVGFPELDGSHATPYSENFYSMDPFVNLPADTVVTMDEMIGYDQLIESDFYQLQLEPSNILHLLGIDIREKKGLKASLRLSRGKQRQPFGDAERELCTRLIPHLQQAISIHARINHIESERLLYASTMGQLSVATVLLNENRQVISTNKIADALLADKDGVKLQRGELKITPASRHQAFLERIDHALANQHQTTPAMIEALAVPRPSGKQAYGVIVRPVPRNEWAEEQSTPTVAIFIRNPEQTVIASEKMLTQLFELSPAEARLALQIANGLSLDEAVDVLCISRNTGRAHLRSIFSKTGISQQTQLVSLILKSVASLG